MKKSNESQSERDTPLSEEAACNSQPSKNPGQPKEIGGQKGPEPTRYGDWEKDGLISDF